MKIARICFILAWLAASCSLEAASVTWSGASNSDFESPANWSALPANDLTSDTAVFPGTIGGNQPEVTLSRSVAGLVFNSSAGGWLVNGNPASNVLTVGAGGISSATQSSGINSIATNLGIGAAQTWSAGPGGTLLFTGTINAANGFPLILGTTTSTGTIVLSPASGNSISVSGTNDAALLFQVRTGTLVLGGDGIATPATTSNNSIVNSGAYGALTVTGTGALRVNSGSWNFGDFSRNGTADYFTGSLMVNGGTLSLSGARYLASGNITVSGGSLKVSNFGSVYSNGGKFALGSAGSAGTASMSVTGGLVDLAQANGSVSGGNSIGVGISARILQSGGTVQSGVTAGGGLNGGPTNTLTIGHSGLTSTGTGTTIAYTAVSNVLASYTLSGGTLLSAGAIQGTTPATAGTNGSAANPPNAVVNPGTGNLRNFNFNGGTLSTGAFVATNLGYASSTGVAGGGPNNDPAANSVGIGTLYNNGGTLAPGGVDVAGKTAITGNYVVNNGTLAIDLGGTTQATAFQTGQYDSLTISGTTTLAGQLTVKVLPGFNPVAGNTFNIVTGTGMLSGAFSNVAFGSRIVSTDGLSSFVVSQVGNTVTLGQFLPVTPPTLSIASGSPTYTAGENAVLAVNVSSLSPVTYQWYRGATAIDGATGSSLTLPGLQDSNSGSYSVIVTNSAGSTTQIFNIAVTVPSSTGSVVIPAGGSQSFSAGSAAVSFAWSLDGVPVGTSSPTYNWSPDTNAVGTHWLKVKETYPDATTVVRQWAVRVSLILPTSSVQYYVSPTGVDTNSGSIGSPFRTLEKARDTIRLLSRPLPAGGVTVVLRGGTHFRTSTFSLGTSDSGTASAPIIYANYPGETAVISGGKPVLSSQFTPLAGSELSRVAPGVDTSRIWEADMTALGLARKGPFPLTYNEWQIYNIFGAGSSAGTIELFYNGKRMPLSRYPNRNLTDDSLTTSLKMNGVAAGADTAGTGYLNAAGNYTDSNGSSVAVGGAFQYNPADESHILRWQTALAKGGVWVAGYWRVPWQINGAKVGILDTGAKKTIGLASNVNISGGIGYKYSRPIGNKAEPWWVVNLLEELDQPGEWCMDFSRNKIYFLMDAANAPPDNSVVLSDLGAAMVQITGSYVNFQGITFENGLSQGVQVLGGSRNLVLGCSFRNMGGYPVDLNNLTGGTFNGVVGCNMSNLASGGVIVRGGNSISSPRVPTNNFVVNNQIADYAQVVRVYAAAVDVGYQYGGATVGVRVAHNRISGSPHGAIIWKQYDHTIEYNDVGDYCYYSNDFGGIYTFAPNYVSGTNIRYNYLHDSDHGEGIYLDSDHINASVYGNIVSLKTLSSESRGTGFYDQTPSGALTSGVPYSDTLFNNIAVNCRTGFQIYSTTGGKIENNFSYKNLSADYKWNRLTVGASSVTWSSSSASVLGSGPNPAYSTDPGFLDFTGSDLRLRPDAKALTDLPNFEPPPFEMMGVYNDEFRSDANIYPPFVITNPASLVGANTAAFNGLLVYPQFERNATVRLYWGMTDGGTDPAAWQNVTNVGTPGSGPLSSVLTTLSPGTRYYYRYYAVNAAGEDWAEQGNSTTTYPIGSVATGGVATASSAGSPAANAFDGNASTSWQSAPGQTTAQLQYQFAGNGVQRATRYQITSSTDSPAKDPRDWQFLGSFDGSTWVTLDTRTGETFSTRGQTRTFGFANNNAFRFYRLDITASNGDSGGVQLAELQLFAPEIVADTTGPVITTPGNITASGTSAGAYVNFEVSAVDAVSGNAVATANPASGSFFNLGNTPVTVTATDAAGNISAAMFVVTVTAPALPSPWTIRQIAQYSGVAAGTATVPNASSFQISGTGGASTGGTTGDMWTGNNDSFTYVSQPWIGDGSFTARIASFSSTDSSAKAGITFRETTSQGSRYSSTYFLRKGDAWDQHKTATSGSTTNTNFFTASSSGKGIPYWIRLVRMGDVFTNFISPDGVTWTQLGTARSNPLSGTALTVGFCVAPRTGGSAATVVFDNISFVAPLVAPTGLSATGGNAQVGLSWNTVPTANSYVVKRSTTPDGAFANLATGLGTSSYSDNSVTNGTSYYYVVTASNSLGESAPSALTMAIPLSDLQNWRNLYFNSIDNTGDSANLANPDGDALNNLLEYAFGGNPFLSDDVSPATSINSQGFLQISFNRLRSDLTYYVQGTNDLSTWKTLATNPGLLGSRVIFTDSSTIPNHFLRLKIIAP